jgi:hypothetical protein
MKKTITKPNPTPQSPVQVSESSDYEVMTDYIPGHYWPSADEIVVRHKKSNTYWRAVYAVREDDSDADMGATWKQVAPKKVTITKYEAV